MFENKNHVGRPSNEELRKKRNKKLIITLIPVILILVVASVFLLNGSLSGLMGNSVTSYYCDSGYTLSGNKCIKKIQEKAYYIGDINKDGTINVNDQTTLQKYLSGTKLDENQISLADVDQNGIVNIDDLTSFQLYFRGTTSSVSTSSQVANENYIGTKKVCGNSYTLNGDYCEKIETVSAKTRNYSCDDSSYTLSGTKCIKTIQEKSYFIGDVNKDGNIDINDQTTLQQYFAGAQLDENQMALADVDQNGVVNVSDLTSFQLYFSDTKISVSTSSPVTNENYIGTKKVCGSNYKLSGNYCVKTDTVNAVLK